MIVELECLKISRIDENGTESEQKDKTKTSTKTEPRRSSVTGRRGSLASLLSKVQQSPTSDITSPLRVRRRSILQRQDTSKVEMEITSRTNKPKLQRRNTSTVEMQIQTRGKNKRRHSLICGADQLASPEEQDPAEEVQAQKQEALPQPWLSVLATTKMDMRKKVRFTFATT